MSRDRLLITALLISTHAAAQVGTAPYGDPVKVATIEISKAEHPVGASHLPCAPTMAEFLPHARMERDT